MSPAHVLEPTYQKIKRGLMEGLWHPGERLEALRLADEFGVSMTPVRDCLNRLVGERLVDMQPGDGYRVPRITEMMMRDMLELHAMLLEHALLHPVEGSNMSFQTENLGEEYAARVTAFFRFMAARAANKALAEALLSLGDRIYVIRRWEPQLFIDCDNELEELERHLAGDTEGLNTRLRRYHDRRRNSVAELVQLAQS